MRDITPIITGEIRNYIGRDSVVTANAYPVSNYRELMNQIAKLSYSNKDYLLFFRGQDRDYRNRAGASTLYPSIYRGIRIPRPELDMRFDILESSSRSLSDELHTTKTEGHGDVKRRPFIQWSILQHYQICATPLLDLTHSLRVACSFAFLSSTTGNPYLFVFGLPYVTNSISIHSEHDIVNIRLLSICPPDALRPYYQEGYLAGTTDITREYDDKSELDFNNRLIAKFQLKRTGFWGRGFKPILRSVLYPKGDVFESICSRIKIESDSYAGAAGIGTFLKMWHNLENIVLNEARIRKPYVYSIKQAIDILSRDGRIEPWYKEELNKIRILRNRVVHEPSEVKTKEISQAMTLINKIIKQVNIRLTISGSD